MRTQIPRLRNDLVPGSVQPVVARQAWSEGVNGGAARSMKTKRYAHWINCIKDDCPEGSNGKCERTRYEHCFNAVYGRPTDFPDDGKCYFSDFLPYDEALEALGAYETEEEV